MEDIEFFDQFPLDFHVESKLWGWGGVSIYSRYVLDDFVAYPERVRVEKKVTKKEAIAIDADIEPLMVLSNESAVKLMDALWKAGIRPSGGVQAAHEAIEILSNMLIAAKEKSEK